MVTYRIDRINKEFLRAIAELLGSRIKKQEAKEALLTEVSVSRDLSHAKVFYTLLDESRREVVQQALESVGGQIRSILGKEMRLRMIPELHFIFDESEKNARKMDELLDSIMQPEAASEVGDE